MPAVVYVGPFDEVESAPTGVALRGVPVEVDEADVEGLVGAGDGVWRLAENAPPINVAAPVVDAAPAPQE
jgi:hypothetical protein